MYEKIFYSDSFFQLFVRSVFSFLEFEKHKDIVIDTFLKYSNKEIDKYPSGFWHDTMGLINTRIILDYLIDKNELTIRGILNYNKQQLISHGVRYMFHDMTIRELIDTIYPDTYYKTTQPPYKSYKATTKVVHTKDKISRQNSNVAKIFRGSDVEVKNAKPIKAESKIDKYNKAIEYFNKLIESGSIDDAQLEMYKLAVAALEKQIKNKELVRDLVDFVMDITRKMTKIFEKYDL